MLSDEAGTLRNRDCQGLRLNAPYGARCFLTTPTVGRYGGARKYGLNAPYGARCFLTRCTGWSGDRGRRRVLMHLMALGAF